MADETATVTATRQRKKRKWDQPAEAIVSSGLLQGLLPFTGTLPGLPSLVGAFPNLMTTVGFPSIAHNYVSNAVQQSAAAAVAQKISQDLLSKGLVPQTKIQDELIAREITINDAESGVRYKLTKRQTQEEIQAKTGAVVITRGRYRPPNGQVESEKPLYLHISAGVHLKDTAERIKAVDQAAAMVEEMLKQGRQTLSAATSSSVSVPCAASVYVGLEAVPPYNLLGRIRGPNDQYINHIMNETGATVTLRGRGSGNRDALSGEELPQPLHLYITGDNTKSVEDAKILSENLIQTVRPLFQNSMTGSSPVVQYGPANYGVSPVPSHQPTRYMVNGVPNVGYPTCQLPSNGAQIPPYVGMQPSHCQPASAVGIQSSSAPQIAIDLGTHRCPPNKTYGAVPPPVQLLDQSGVQSSAAVEKSSVGALQRIADSSFPAGACSSSSTRATLTSEPSISQTTYSVISSHTTAVASLSAYQHVGNTQPVRSGGRVIPPTHSLSHGSSYSGYDGVYPQASPLQQVAQVLQRAPPPVSLKPNTVAVSTETPTKAQSSYTQEKLFEKQHSQRRKFQEFPLCSSKEVSEDEQLQAGGLSSRLTVNGTSGGSDASTSDPRISHLVRSMPPPPPKAPATQSTLRKSGSLDVPPRPTAHAGEEISAVQMSPHHTGLRLVEYGEEEEELSTFADSFPPGGQVKQFASNRKPFWAP